VELRVEDYLVDNVENRCLPQKVGEMVVGSLRLVEQLAVEIELRCALSTVTGGAHFLKEISGLSRKS
jgi:hypothetical protein